MLQPCKKCGKIHLYNAPCLVDSTGLVDTLVDKAEIVDSHLVDKKSYYKDLDKRRAYQREWISRKRRATRDRAMQGQE